MIRDFLKVIPGDQGDHISISFGMADGVETVSQLKKYLCYDNFNFDKKRYRKLNTASVSDVFALVSVEIYS